MDTHATQYAQYYHIDPQQEGESDSNFRGRVAGHLREKNLLIEAHEAFNNCRWDDKKGGDKVVTGIAGALAQMLYKVDYHAKDGYQKIGDDIAVGTIVQHPEDDSAAMLALLTIMLGLK